MKRTAVLQGVRLMRFEAVLAQWENHEMSQAEAAPGSAT